MWTVSIDDVEQKQLLQADESKSFVSYRAIRLIKILLIIGVGAYSLTSLISNPQAFSKFAAVKDASDRRGQTLGQIQYPTVNETMVLSETERYRSVVSHLHESAPEINGNDLLSVRSWQREPGFTFQRISGYDHDDGFAFFSAFRNTIITGQSMKLFDGSRIYFPGGCDFYPDPFPHDRVVNADPSSVIYLDEVLLVSQYWGGAYYHWMIEGLPRVALMLPYLEKNPNLKLLMLHHGVADALFDLMDIPADRIVWYDTSSVYLARKTVCPSPSLCGKGISTALRSLKALLRAKFQEKYPKLAEPKPEPYVIVVQSRGNSKRSLTNHNDLMQALRNAQPDALIVEFGPNEDIISTIAKHYHADIVIGPHGAGLSNVIFAPDGSTMLELHPNVGNNQDEGPPHFVNGCHQRTAQRSGMHAILLLEDNGADDRPFTANVPRVIDAVAQIRAARWDSIDRYHGSTF